MNRQWVIFTDLDGTLLARESYSYAAAQPALTLIQQQDIPLILNSSKTVAEMLLLRAELGNQHPFVVENGAAVIIPRHYFDDITASENLLAIDFDLAMPGSFLIKRFSQSHEQIIAALAMARAAGFQFAGFSDWSNAELAAISGLPGHKAAHAKQRMGSEPILLESDINKFTEFLARHNLRVVQGGRFLHVMGHYDKADGVAWLLNAYQKKYAPARIQSVALGDSHNDEGMLNAVDVPVVVKSPHSAQINLMHPARARFTTSEGPVGWNQQLLDLLRH